MQAVCPLILRFISTDVSPSLRICSPPGILPSLTFYFSLALDDKAYCLLGNLVQWVWYGLAERPGVVCSSILTRPR